MDEHDTQEERELTTEEFIEDIFSTPEKLNKFLDETDFDDYHEFPREDYFPMLKKKGDGE
jgi:hypothetical protein